MRKQVLMYLLSKEENLIRVLAHETRNAAKFVFKVPHRIAPKYEKSPFYIGTKLWDEVSIDIQHARSVFDFKKDIDKKYKKYEDLLK